MASDPGAVLVPPFPFHPAHTADLAAALAEAIEEHDRALAALLGALTACIWSLRDDQHMTPEHAVITMKAMLRHTASVDASRRKADLALVDFWMDDLVTWCIGEYFRRE